MNTLTHSLQATPGDLGLCFLASRSASQLGAGEGLLGSVLG